MRTHLVLLGVVLGAGLAATAFAQNPAARGEAVYAEQKCSVCHSIGDKGNKKGPLDGIGTFFRGTSHHNSNIVIDFVSDTEANVRSVVLAIHRYTRERPDGILYGQYFDTVVKTADGWKFKRRELRTTMTTDYHVKASNPIGRAE